MKLIDRIKLKKLDTSNIDDFFKNRRIIAKVIDCYDGDTCTIVFYISKELIKLNLRLLDIDTAEMPRKKDNSDKTESEYKMALEAKRYLEEQVLNECVIVDIKKWDKYGGRVLGHIYKTNKWGREIGESISDMLLKEELAVPYDGKKKVIDWDEQYKKLLNKNNL